MSSIRRDSHIHQDYFKKTHVERLGSSQHEFWLQRVRTTSQRIRVLDILKKSARPLSQREISEQLLDIHPSTIYRIIHKLIIMKLIWKVYPRTKKRALFEIRPTLRTRIHVTDKCDKYNKYNKYNEIQ